MRGLYCLGKNKILRPVWWCALNLHFQSKLHSANCMGYNNPLTLLHIAGLLAGVAARAQRREYMQLLADCQRVYCEMRLLLVADVVAARMADYSREPLPSLTRSGCSYLMQARSPSSVHALRQPTQAVPQKHLCILPPVHTDLYLGATPW